MGYTPFTITTGRPNISNLGSCKDNDTCGTTPDACEVIPLRLALLILIEQSWKSKVSSSAANDPEMHTWRVIPVSKWLATSIYKPWKNRPFGKGSHYPRNWGPMITMVKKQLLCFPKDGWFPIPVGQHPLQPRHTRIGWLPVTKIGLGEVRWEGWWSNGQTWW